MARASDPLPRGITRARNELATDDAVGVHLPVGFRAMATDEGFTLVVKQRPLWGKFLLLFAVLWNGFMLLWFTLAIGSGAWPMAAFGTIHALVGIVIGYIALRLVFNRVELRVTRGVLALEHKPLPWPSPSPLPRADIAQLYVRADHNLKVNGRPVERYELRVRERSGKERALLMLENLDQARYLEAEIERAFAIQDAAVPSELPKA